VLSLTALGGRVDGIGYVLPGARNGVSLFAERSVQNIKRPPATKAGAIAVLHALRHRRAARAMCLCLAERPLVAQVFINIVGSIAFTT
jgi:hypothetical protein